MQVKTPRQPPTHPLIGQLVATLPALGFAAPDVTNPPLIVAVSGGRDSVVLLHALAELAPAYGLILHVAHLDHALRPESADDADFVAATARSLSLPRHLHRLDPTALSNAPDGPEAGARRQRYRFLLQVAANVTPEQMVPTVAVAHHAGDQAETLLLHLARGAGLPGLAGMQMSTTVTPAHFAEAGAAPDSRRATRLIRPLLTTQPALIADFAAARALAWREDATNADLTLARNRIRHRVLPELAAVNPQVVATLARTADILAGEAARADTHNRQALAAVLIPTTDASPGARLLLDLTRLKAFDRATQRGVIRLVAQTIGPAAGDLAFEHVERLLGGTDSSHVSGPHPLAGGLAWSVGRLVEGDTGPVLSLHRQDLPPFAPDRPQLRAGDAPCAIPDTGVLTLDSGWQLHSCLVEPATAPHDWRSAPPWEGWFDADALAAPVLCTPQPGMRLAPLGLGGRRQRVGDLFTNRHIHPTLRHGWPLVCDERGTVHWLCGLRTADSSQITPMTRRVRHLRWTRQHS